MLDYRSVGTIVLRKKQGIHLKYLSISRFVGGKPKVKPKHHHTYSTSVLTLQDVHYSIDWEGIIKTNMTPINGPNPPQKWPPNYSFCQAPDL